MNKYIYKYIYIYICIYKINKYETSQFAGESKKVTKRQRIFGLEEEEEEEEERGRERNEVTRGVE